ncbi:hypothetical protein IHQ71_07950 [Rhizobium sp. TH2]|uniref:hypothetical protein n=1 Tax=Rhizobium sp. TH2 TaxID=2775403 RepID=UPI00215811B0|nr:hypothetical protein [Rhizobium sp. TH2]UVC10515.1 hypothetical protein IHQ71_07950 [Rhizobium sp. TH2]
MAGLSSRSAIALFDNDAVVLDFFLYDAAAADHNSRTANPDATAPTPTGMVTVTVAISMAFPTFVVPAAMVPAGVMTFIPTAVTPLVACFGSGRKAGGSDEGGDAAN